MQQHRAISVRFATTIGFCLLATLADCSRLKAEDQPVTIATALSGHIHPSICRTKDGTLIVVYKGANVLMRTRSTDSGQTWEKPEVIATSAKRPDVIREVKTFEVYPGTADVLPDDRVLVTWNYIADDKAKDGYYERALLYSISPDQGRTWSDQGLIGPVEGKHLGAVRHNVLPWNEGRWLLPLRVGPPRLFDPTTGGLTVFSLTGPDHKQHSFQQIVRTAKGTLLAMGPVLLRSTDQGHSWTTVESFRAVPDIDTAEGRYLTVLTDGRVLVTWGVGTTNKGLRYNFSADDGLTWNNEHTTLLLPETSVAARYYSARTVQIDDQHIGTVFVHGGVYFLKVSLNRVAKIDATPPANAPTNAPTPPEKKLPMSGEVFRVDGQTAFVIAPEKKASDGATPWVWYAPTLPNLPGTEERWMFERFTKAGIAIAGIDVGESYGSPDGRKLFSAFHRELTEKRGFARKPVLLGRSRGGLMTLGWAVENADKVGGFAGVYPVCNIASYPGVPQASGAYHLKPDELAAQLTDHNPIDRLAALARAKVPLFAIHGDVDKVVPLEANSGEVRKRYQALGGQMQLVVPAGQGHNMWPGFFQCQELVDFAIANARSK
ncbi:MAG: exo-alpha-sialidase [Planctomycetales bacterium]|nr:exo-alpha-sialidase [Planctomycetales bacterium]